MESPPPIDINRIKMDPWNAAVSDSRAEAHRHTRSHLATLNYSEFLKYTADSQAFKNANQE